MKLKEAISRCRFTISKGNKPNETDVSAFNVILEHFKKEQTQTIQDNLLFAKLYAHVLQRLTEHYGDVNFANKQLNKILSEPMQFRIDMLLTQLKFTELNQNICDPMLQGKNEEELREIFKRYPKFQEEFTACWDWWNTDNVTAHLNTQINLSIQEFKNYV